MTSENPLLIREGLPAFDRIRPEHVEPAVDAILAEAEGLLKQAEAAPLGDWDALMEPRAAMDRLFEYGWSPIGHLMGVANSDELRKAYEGSLPKIVQFSLRSRQSKPIYERFCALRDGAGWASMESGKKRIVEQAIRSAEQAGIALEGAQLDRFNEISQELKLSSDFSNHVLDATKAFHMDITNPADVKGMPESLQAAAAARPGPVRRKVRPRRMPRRPWRVTLDFPSFGPFMQHCPSSDLRKTVYMQCTSPALRAGEWDNSPLILRTLELRREMAGLLGFDNYAELSLSNKMAPDVAAVRKMSEELLTASFEGGKRDLGEINDLARENGVEGPLKHWDVSFWSERLREKRFNYTDEELRPYFSLPRALDGLFSLVHRLFGITVKAADGKAPVWNNDVRFFEVFGPDGDAIAAFYLDPYSRPANKRGGAWMDDCISREVSGGRKRLPVAHLTCNGTPPVGDTPSLMTFREVETLFHEFGHGLQHMLTRVNLRDVSGISGVEWDAVELPSQFMENWCYHKPTLLGMAKHYQTGETLPEELFEKICAARTYHAASMLLRQLQFGMVDMELHSNYDPKGSKTPFDVNMEIARRTSAMTPMPENRFLCSFSHIFAGGYAAGYYSYLWAEVLSSDAFSAFEDAGLDNEKAVAETGMRFRETVLAEGGSRHPMDVFRDFRGREPSTEPLLRHRGL
ncbi:MAG: M3 family metallopeptidase, partial [Planctomycetota bacterium]